jgi:TonB family protein
MEKIRRNILMSVMFHSALLAAVFVIGSSSMQQTKKILMVSLFSEWQAGSANPHVNTEQRAAAKSTPAAVPGAPARQKPVERAERVERAQPTQLAQLAPANTQAAAMPTPAAQTVSIAAEKDAQALVDTGLRASANTGYGYGRVAGDLSRETGSGGSMSSGVPMAVLGSGTEASGTGVKDGRDRQTGDIDPALRRKIRDSLQSNLVYPYLARKKHIEGTVLAEFRLDAAGMPENMKIVKTSSYAILDKAAKETIQKAAPYPAHNRRVEIPITFRLQD